MRRILGNKLRGIGLAALCVASGASAFTVDDFVLSDEAGLSPVAYFAFVPITNNGDRTNIDLGLAVSFGNIDGTDRMFFELVNESTDPNHTSSVKSLYFSATELSGVNPYNEGTAPGVEFSIGSNGGGNQGFDFTINHALDALADPPPASSGVNPNESLLVGYSILNGADPEELLNALKEGDWNIGLHIISTAPDGEKSEKYVATFLPGGPQDPFAPVPEPATLALLGMGALFVAGRMRFDAK
jgi:hypothetical protein